MKLYLQRLVTDALSLLIKKGVINLERVPDVQIERARDTQHGDYACNIALIIAKTVHQKPRDLAELIIAHLPSSSQLERVQVAGPGFINFYLSTSAYYDVVKKIQDAGDLYGYSNVGKDQKVLVEFVSANPTGPLHVGHGRGAAYGAAVSNLLQACGYQVNREYYVNDSGRQMDILAVSVWLRYLELCGDTIDFPSNAYQGDYIFDIAADLHRSHKTKFYLAKAIIEQELPTLKEGTEQKLKLKQNASNTKNKHSNPQVESELQDSEAYIDALIGFAKQQLGGDQYQTISNAGISTILSEIRSDLTEFGVLYDNWFSEKSLYQSQAVDKAIEILNAHGYVYEKDKALWFRSAHFGDEKDHVLIRENGQKTYFASDVAYHLNKFERGFNQIINIWGADHHGYIARLKAVLQALGKNPDDLSVLLVQFAILYRAGKKVSMSTRAGEFVSLRQLRAEVGNDAARFFYVMRKCEQHLDFDLDLAKSQANENPVFYIQYAHARICSVLQQLTEKHLVVDKDTSSECMHLLTEQHEQTLLATLANFPEIIETAAQNYEPHRLTYYLRKLANDFHTYYNAHQFLVEEQGLRSARIALISAVRQVISNGLKLIGVSVPEKM